MSYLPSGRSRAVYLSALVPMVALVAGCAADAAPDDVQESALSQERVRVLPLDDASRTSCRNAASRVYCSRDAAEVAARCGAPGKVVVETSRGRCDADGEAYPTVSSCEAPAERDCSWYSACLERAIPCGAEGYALGFGEKYCTAFRAGAFSNAGKIWVTKVMQCLQRALVDDVVEVGAFATSPASSAVCKATFDKAFASHPACYTAKEASICDLPPTDLARVLSTIGLAEILRPRTGLQMVSTAAICVGQITNRIFGRKRVNDTTSSLSEPGRTDDDTLLEVWQRLEVGDRTALDAIVSEGAKP